MRRRAVVAAAAAGLACVLACAAQLLPHAFTTVTDMTRSPGRSSRGAPLVGAEAERGAFFAGATGRPSTPQLAILGLAGAIAVATCARGARVLMRGSKGHRNYRLKGKFWPVRRRTLYNTRKTHDTEGALRSPPRYKLWDDLEELDKVLPHFKVISVPDEPQQPQYDVPIKYRYPWAGEVNAHKHQAKWQPWFGNFIWEMRNPTARREQWEGKCRIGVPLKHNTPKWFYQPDYQGLKPDVPGGTVYVADRRVPARMYSDSQLEQIAEMPESETRNMHPTVRRRIERIRRGDSGFEQEEEEEEDDLDDLENMEF